MYSWPQVAHAAGFGLFAPVQKRTYMMHSSGEVVMLDEHQDESIVLHQGIDILSFYLVLYLYELFSCLNYP